MFDFNGIHILAEFSGVLSEQEGIESVFLEIEQACNDTGLTLVDMVYHEFIGGGFTVVGLLQESHFSIHYYAEYQSAFIDIFTCGRVKPYRFYERIKELFAPEKESFMEIIRGNPYQT